MELDGYDDAQINTPDMVTNACYLNHMIALVQVLIQGCLIKYVFNLMLKILNLQVMLLKLYAKCCQANSTDKALHTPWCHNISGLRRVSLAEYILVLRIYSLLLQMI